ncbi:hypothetical protein [Haloarcula hispanica pleomorphic virus 4]|uniref:Uncharacterized protein n=1 Tax=Haloarcula hispanica pleomorphic virus 4 TaxID=1980140 RepID=A0A2P0QGZ4_9VIRU|nr:hypothetical protein HOS97_gp24 [Haloarcula hispanica pleomorphic virus 4]ARM71138.1 hypothetical protein [Haloarcula hispanica pleomorphic virus 4]
MTHRITFSNRMTEPRNRQGPSSFCLNRIRYEPAAIGVRAGGERRNRGAKTPALNSEFNKHLVGGSRRLAILRFGGADDE